MADWGYTYLLEPEDHLWLDEGLRQGWELPVAAHELWRVWGVRHLRAFWMIWKAYHDFEEGSFRALWHKEWVAHAVAKGWV